MFDVFHFRRLLALYFCILMSPKPQVTKDSNAADRKRARIEAAVMIHDQEK